MNIASKANNGEGRNDVINLTAWGKLADVCAKSMSPGKEFHCSAKLKTFDARVWYNQQPVTMGDGTVLTTKKVGFSITELTFGDESAKHIANEIQSGIRPVDWNAAGAPGYAAWREKLKQRNALVFDPTQPVFGYAKVILPQGPGIGAYTPQAAGTAFVAPGTGAAVEAAVVNAAANPAVVSAALFTPVQTPADAPVVGAVGGGFAAPAGV
jgi:single-stranded DNA-binding protein